MKPTESSKNKILLALIKIHRDINNNNRVSWHKAFSEAGYKNPNSATKIKETLQKMNIIHVDKKGRYTWNAKKTTPCTQLVDGIFLQMKEDKPIEKPSIKENNLQRVIYNNSNVVYASVSM